MKFPGKVRAKDHVQNFSRQGCLAGGDCRRKPGARELKNLHAWVQDDISEETANPFLRTGQSAG